MRKINARSCVIRSVNLNEEISFLDDNHTQKYARSTVCYGLYFEEELVQLMSFGKPRFNKNYQWELIRECSKNNCLVRGGSSKLWNYFLKNNQCHSCICYHYPHDKKNLYTTHLIDYCGFKCIQNAKPAIKVYFEGEWNGELKRIDKSILERHGVDRLLNTSQGQDRSNEQILADLGFKKKYEDGYSPQIDIFYPFGVVYRVDDLTDGSFYIGMCEVKEKWDNEYLGSGIRWNRHLLMHTDHVYRRVILHECKTPKETRILELKEIKKFFKYKNDEWIKINEKCLNTQVRTQSQEYIKRKCLECGGVNNSHYSFCSKSKKCEKCGGSNGIHKKDCVLGKICDECGASNGQHKKNCSKSLKCDECGASNGHHTKKCSKYLLQGICKECGNTNSHKKNCSHYRINTCIECGKNYGKHLKTCSKYKEFKKCEECGYLLVSHTHARTCSKYKEKSQCEECGGKSGNHKSSCSHSTKCKECGGVSRHHFKFCSKYKCS